MSRRAPTTLLIIALLLVMAAMPLVLGLCGESGQHILPSMEGHRCVGGIQNLVLHLTTWLLLVSVILTAAAVVALALFLAGCVWTDGHHGPPRLQSPPPTLRARECLRLAADFRTIQKALALGLVPERHPTI